MADMTEHEKAARDYDWQGVANRLADFLKRHEKFTFSDTALILSARSLLQIAQALLASTNRAPEPATDTSAKARLARATTNPGYGKELFKCKNCDAMLVGVENDYGMYTMDSCADAPDCGRRTKAAPEPAPGDLRDRAANWLSVNADAIAHGWAIAVPNLVALILREPRRRGAEQRPRTERL